MDEMNDSRSRKLKPLDAMNRLGLGKMWKIHGHEPMDLNAMNNLG